MRSIEARLGVRLLNRTTRSVTPTEAGKRLLSSFTPLQEQVTSMLDSVSQFRLPRPCPAPQPFHFYFHCQKHMPHALRAFVNFIKELRLETAGEGGL